MYSKSNNSQIKYANIFSPKQKKRVKYSLYCLIITNKLFVVEKNKNLMTTCDILLLKKKMKQENLTENSRKTKRYNSLNLF